MNIKELKEYIKDLPDDMELDEYFCWIDWFYQPAMHKTKYRRYLLINQIKWNTEIA